MPGKSIQPLRLADAAREDAVRQRRAAQLKGAFRKRQAKLAVRRLPPVAKPQ